MYRLDRIIQPLLLLVFIAPALLYDQVPVSAQTRHLNSQQKFHGFSGHARGPVTFFSRRSHGPVTSLGLHRRQHDFSRSSRIRRYHGYHSYPYSYRHRHGFSRRGHGFGRSLRHSFRHRLFGHRLRHR